MINTLLNSQFVLCGVEKVFSGRYSNVASLSVFFLLFLIFFRQLKHSALDKLTTY